MVDGKRATVKELKDFFESNGGRKVTMKDLKDLKGEKGESSRDYDQIADGIGNGTLTY